MNIICSFPGHALDRDQQNSFTSSERAVMSLLRFVKPSRLQLLVGRSFGTVPSLVSRRLSSSVAEGEKLGAEGLAEGDSLKSVEDVPGPSNKWSVVWNTLFTTDKFHEQSFEASSGAGNLWRLPVPFLKQHLITTSSPQHVSEMFRNEGALPFRPGANHLEDFMVERGFAKGIVIT